MKLKLGVVALAFVGLCVAGPAQAQFTTLWQVGLEDLDWPRDGVGGGPEADFVQETGTNPPPGDPMSPATDGQADDDYYFAGDYPTPIGTVAADEIAVERAFAGTDNYLRFHFNLPAGALSLDRYRFTTAALNFDANGTDPRYGLTVAAGVGADTGSYTVVMPEVVLRNDSDIGVPVTTPVFTAADVGWQTGPGIDNVIELRGGNLGAEGGGNWMGLDYHRLEREPVAPPVVPALSDVGLLVLALLLINLGAFIIRRRRSKLQPA